MKAATSLFAILSVAWSACGSVSGGDGNGDGDGDGDAGVSFLSIEFVEPTIDGRIGTMAAVSFRIERGAGVTGDVRVSAINLPAGIVVPDVVVPESQTEGSVLVTLSPSLEAGAAQPVSVEATNSNTTATAEFELFVLGSAGTLDISFGGDGIVPFTPPAGFALRSTTVGDDDSLYFGGTLADSALAIWKLTPSGAPDTSFGIGGLASVGFADLGEAAVFATSLAIQSNGSVVTIGRSPGAVPRLLAARFTPDGELDSTFGTAGRRVHSFSSGGLLLHELRVTTGDSLVAGGCTDPFGVFLGDYVVVKLEPNSDLDTAFDGDGVGVAAADGCLSSIEISSTGAIFGLDGGDPSTVIAVNANGGADSNFGAAGLASVSTIASAFGLADSGETYAGGTESIDIATVGPPMITKLTPTGALDPTFGNGGDLVFSPGNGSVIFVDPEPTGLLAVIQLREGIVSGDLVVTRLDGTGTLDPSFGTAGELRLVDTQLTAYIEASPHSRLLLVRSSTLVRMWR